MSSQKKSSTKVGAKNAAPTGQRQYSNLLRSKKAASVKVNSKPIKSIAYIATSNTQVSRGSPTHLMRTGLKSELLGIVTSKTALFDLLYRLRINPLSRATFKWLPSIAQNFESFKFHMLRIRYENRCATTTAGSVIMSPSYDSADSDAQAATEALLYENKGTLDFSVWKSGALDMKPAAMNRLYKSHTCMSDERFNTTTQDPKTIDPAQVFICLDGVVVGPSVGKVFLDYDCEFFEPHAPTEPINQGGSTVWEPGSITPNSTQPFVYLPNVNVNEEVPILNTVQQLVQKAIISSPTGGSPSSVIGQLAKDYAGVINILTTGTGVGDPKAYLSSDPLSPAGSVGDRLLGGSLGGGITNAAGTANITEFVLSKGLAGNFIKIATPLATSISQMKFQLAGTSAI